MRIESLVAMALALFATTPFWAYGDSEATPTQETKTIEVGKPAPNFTRKDQHGQEVSLSEFKGQWVVLYFYPKADTSGCTTQACELSDNIEPFNDLQAVILGMSPDTVEEQKKFAEKYKLKITLLSDPGREVMRIYKGVNEEGRLMRSTLIINPEGVVAHHWPSVSPRGHAKMVREKLEELRIASASTQPSN